MADLEKTLPLAMAKQWENKDTLNNPVLDVHQGFKQPDRVEVRRVVNMGDRQEMAKIMLD